MNTSPADPAPADPAPPAAGWPFTIGDGCVRLAVRLTPGASADRLLGVAADEAGLPVLRAQVTAAPENGKANAALVGLLAKRWRLPRSSITVMQGATGRRKLLRIAGEPAALARRIMEALERDD